MTFVVEVSADGVSDAARAVGGPADRTDNLRPAFDRVRLLFAEAEQQRFETRGLGHWAPILPSTQLRKLEKGQDPRVLRATGSLFRSLTQPSAGGSVFETSRYEVTLGTSVEHAKYHQGGRGREDRPVILVTERMRREFVEALQQHVSEE